MKDDILVSIGVESYNQSNFIKQTLDSILIQKTNFKYEILVNDDCSTDGTAEIIKEYEQRYPDIIKPLYQTENQFSKNIGIAKNFIFPRVKGKYFAICEGDDYFIDENKLQKQVDFLEAHPEFVGCFHPVKVIYENIKNKVDFYPNKNTMKGKNVITLDDLLMTNYIQTNSVMYRWRFVDEKKFDFFPDNMLPGDWYLHLLHAQNGDIAFLPDVMAVYRRHDNGIWIDSLKNIDNLHLKHGVKEINFYYNVYKNITNFSDDYFNKILLPSVGNILKIYFNNEKFEDIYSVYEAYPDIFNKAIEFNRQDINLMSENQNRVAHKFKKYKKLFNIFLVAAIVLAVLNIIQFFILLWIEHIF